MILIADPEMIKEIAVKQFNNFSDRRVYTNYHTINNIIIIIILCTEELHVDHCKINSLRISKRDSSQSYLN